MAPKDADSYVQIDDPTAENGKRWVLRDHAQIPTPNRTQSDDNHTPTSSGPGASILPFRPALFAQEPDLAAITHATWDVLQLVNNPPRYFRQSGIPVRIESGDDGEPSIREMGQDEMRLELAEVADWWKLNDRDQHVGARPPMDVVRSVLAMADPPLPVLLRVVEAPVFGRDLSLCLTPGYHAASRAYYAPPSCLSIPPVPDVPTDHQVTTAKTLLIDDLLADFPFSSDADRANAIGLGLLPFVREYIVGPTPLHDIEAPTAGTGKGLLLTVLLSPSLGAHIGTIGATDDDDEMRKSITSRLREGKGAIWLDNANKSVTSASLAAALTANYWSDRLLGRNETINIPVRCVWAMTANNPTVSTEIMRRCIPIRMDAEVDRPWERDGFKHANLPAWTADHRGEIIWSYLVLVRNWAAKGTPPGEVSLGSYESWARTIGGILDAAGIPGFLTNRLAFYANADTEGEALRALVVAWWEKFKDRAVRVAQLFDMWTDIQGTDTESDDAGPKRSDRSERTKFGSLIARQRDRVIGEYRIVRADKQANATRWQLSKGTRMVQQSLQTDNLLTSDNLLTY